MTDLDNSGSFIRDPEISEGALGSEMLRLAEKQPVNPGSTIDVQYPEIPLAFKKYLESIFGGYLKPAINVRYALNQHGIAEAAGVEVDFLKKRAAKGLLELDKDLSLVSVGTLDTFSTDYTDLMPRDYSDFLGAIPDELHAFGVDPRSPTTLFDSLDPILKLSEAIRVRQQNSLHSSHITDDFGQEIGQELTLEQTRVISPSAIYTNIKLIDTMTQPGATPDEQEKRKDELELYFDETGTTLSMNHVDMHGTPHPIVADHDRILKIMKRLKQLQPSN